MMVVKANHIPYKGSGSLQTDLLAGRVDLSFQVPISVIAHSNASKRKTFAISGETPAAAVPEVPTFAEAGLSNFNPGGWFGIRTATGTPTPIVERVSKEVASILTLPDVKQ